MFRPPQQLFANNSPFNPYIYDLTNRGYDALFEIGIEPNPARTTGHFPHLFLTACVTSSIEVTTRTKCCEYIEAKTILNLKNRSLGIPIENSKLTPDQLFALKSKEGYRVFALELDRGTEPITSAQLRKSYQKSIEQYRRVVESQLRRKHFGLNGHLLVLWVFTSRRRKQAFEGLLKQTGGRLERQSFTRTFPVETGGWRPPKHLFRILEEFLD